MVNSYFFGVGGRWYLRFLQLVERKNDELSYSIYERRCLAVRCFVPSTKKQREIGWRQIQQEIIIGVEWLHMRSKLAFLSPQLRLSTFLTKSKLHNNLISFLTPFPSYSYSSQKWNWPKCNLKSFVHSLGISSRKKSKAESRTEKCFIEWNRSIRIKIYFHIFLHTFYCVYFMKSLRNIFSLFSFSLLFALPLCIRSDAQTFLI